MAQIQVRTEIDIVDPISPLKVEKLEFTKKVTITELFSVTYSVGTTTEVLLWDGTDSNAQVTDFDVLILMVNGNLDIEMTVNEGDANEELNSFRITKDQPFILTADDAYYNHSASDIWHSTIADQLDVIDKIRAYNPGTSDAVTVRLILGT